MVVGKGIALQLNLITDRWIPVRRKDNSRSTIAPWEIADPDLDFPDWPRPDLNIACLELLIGLVFLADPPRDNADWRSRQTPDPGRLREHLDPFAPFFNLLGDGPRFMQDMEHLENNTKKVNPTDLLFIDSAGGSTSKKNADLTVRRTRYSGLAPPLAAMALYTLQAHSPAGGAGNRTSMRGGGPLLTLIAPPAGGLWDIVWANTPNGEPAQQHDLPWCRTTRISDKGEQVFPQNAHPVETLFGMPRRLRLTANDESVTGVVQQPWGTNYAGWIHPLTPYYRQKPGSELLPRHPRAGPFGYHNWVGTLLRQPPRLSDTARRATVLDLWGSRTSRVTEVIVAGWSMDKMKPLNFVFSRAPLLLTSDDEVVDRIETLVEAAALLATALRGALSPILDEGESRDAAIESFYLETQSDFEARLSDLQSSPSTWPDIAHTWLGNLRDVAISLFDEAALPGLAERKIEDQQRIILARRSLTSAFAGYGSTGRSVYTKLDLQPPTKAREIGPPGAT